MAAKAKPPPMATAGLALLAPRHGSDHEKYAESRVRIPTCTAATFEPVASRKAEQTATRYCAGFKASASCEHIFQPLTPRKRITSGASRVICPAACSITLVALLRHALAKS